MAVSFGESKLRNVIYIIPGRPTNDRNLGGTPELFNCPLPKCDAVENDKFPKAIEKQNEESVTPLSVVYFSDFLESAEPLSPSVCTGRPNPNTTFLHLSTKATVIQPTGYDEDVETRNLLIRNLSLLPLLPSTFNMTFNQSFQYLPGYRRGDCCTLEHN